MFKYVSNACGSVYDYFANWFSRRRGLYEQISEEDSIGAAIEVPDNTPTCKKIFCRILTVGALALDTLFVVFLYEAMRSAIEYAFEELDIPEEIKMPLLIASGVLVGANLISELIIINPIEAAEHMAKDPISGFIGDIRGSNQCETAATACLNTFNQIVAQPSYTIGAAADAVSLAYLTSSVVAKFGYGIPVTFLGVVYYNMLTRTRINQHAKEFTCRLLNCRESMLVNALKNPAKSLEVIIQSLSNGIYRAVSLGYIMDQILVEMFGRSEDDPSNIYYIAFAAFATLYITLFSRTLNVRDQVLNPQFAEIPREVLAVTQVSNLGLGVDVLMTTLRAASAFIIIYRHGLENQTANMMLSSSIGTVLMLQSLYVRYTTRLHQTALDKIQSERPVSIQAEHTSLELFDAIKDHNKTTGLKLTANALNICSRISRSVAFLGFLSVINDALISHGIDLRLEFLDLVCLHQLWGNTTFENELSFFQDFMVENLAYYKTKINMERKNPRFGLFCSFWKTKEDYPMDYLSTHLTLCIEPYEDNTSRVNTSSCC